MCICQCGQGKKVRLITIWKCKWMYLIFCHSKTKLQKVIVGHCENSKVIILIRHMHVKSDRFQILLIIWKLMKLIKASHVSQNQTLLTNNSNSFVKFSTGQKYRLSFSSRIYYWIFYFKIKINLFCPYTQIKMIIHVNICLQTCL